MWTLLTIPRCWYKVWNLWRIDSGDQNKYQIYKNITIIIIIKLLSYFNHKQLKLAPDNSISLSKFKLLINSINKLRSSLYINVFGLKNRSNTLYLSSNRDRIRYTNSIPLDLIILHIQRDLERWRTCRVNIWWSWSPINKDRFDKCSSRDRRKFR